MDSNSFFLKDIVIGQLINHVWKLTEEQIDQFSILSGDYNLLHIYAEYVILLIQIIKEIESEYSEVF